MSKFLTGTIILINTYLMITFFYLEYLVFRHEGFLSVIMPWTWIRIAITMLTSPATLIPMLLIVICVLAGAYMDEKEKGYL